MAVFSTLKLGNSSDKGFGSSNETVKVVTHVLDIARLLKAGYTAGNQIAIMNFPKNSALLHLDAIITEALVTGGSNSVDIGLDVADPDDYVDNQTDTAIGRFTSYVSVTKPQVQASAATLYAEINGAALVSGKISVTIVLVVPGDENPPVATHRTYDHGTTV